MRQFYETYNGNEKLAPLVREISWTNNLLVMARAKTEQAQEFYLLLAAKNRYSKPDAEIRPAGGSVRAEQRGPEEPVRYFTVINLPSPGASVNSILPPLV